ncbi:MAG: serine/threonine-protein kinase [Myxococcota bacterium]
MQKPVFRSTITQALADTVIDESRSQDGRPTPTLDVSSLPDVGDLVGNLYRLVRLLGKGTFGKVYVAERIDVREHQVALKITLREMYSGRDVERELVMLAAAGHPHMVQLKDHGTTPEYVWFTMPVYEGETLATRLQRGTLSLREAYETFLPIARSLAALHRAGLRHQDLKPDNIFLAEFAGRIHPIILDLGVAAERTSQFVAGTILFAAPEQTLALTGVADDLPLNEKMDTYGLAATLLLSLVGMEHFPGANAGTQEEMAAAQQDRAQSPLDANALPELQGRPRDMLIDAFRRWFSIDAAMRSSMTEMAEELDVLLEKEREEAHAEERMRARQKAKLLRTRLAAAALMLMALGFLGWAYSKRETLRLANELEEAKAIGADSFDKLETCQAAQQLTQNDLTNCKALRTRDHANFQHTLKKLSESGDSERNECTQQVMMYSSKLKTCEDEAEAADKACTEERDRLVTEHADEVRELTGARDQCRETVEARTKEIDTLKNAMSSCETELAACQLEAAASNDDPYGHSTSPASAQPIASAPPLPSPPSTVAAPPPPPPDDDPYAPE